MNRTLICGGVIHSVIDCITPVHLPGVTTIGIDAFSSNRLTNIEIPDGVTTIGGYAFYGNQVNSVVIPENTEVDPDAFDSIHAGGHPF